MKSVPLHFVWEYNDVDRAIWAEHLEGWLPAKIIDAHTHIGKAAFRLEPMTEAMRRQYWVNEVFEPIDGPTAAHAYAVVFPGRQVQCLAFGTPDLAFDLDRGNDYVQQECQRLGWHGLAVIRPQWTSERIVAELNRPGVIGVKPYYALIGASRETRDAYLEASIFEFLPHPVLEVLNERRAWVTLHVPKADRLGHPENLREIREVRRRYPDVILVIAHLGRCYTEAHAREALPALADDPGIFFDTSAVINRAAHRIALQSFGPERLLYGSDNPIMLMRGRRQYSARGYVNRTSHPFHFNRDRDPPEVEAKYTLFMYEDVLGIKQACVELGLDTPQNREAIFYGNASRLIHSVGVRSEAGRRGTAGPSQP